MAFILQQGIDILSGAIQHFVEKMEQVRVNLLAWVPESWSAVKEQLLDEEGPGAEMATTMLKNPHYPKIAPAVEALSKLCKALGAMHNSGFGIVVDINLLKQCQDVIPHSSQRAYCTYLFYMLRVHIATKARTLEDVV